MNSKIALTIISIMIGIMLIIIGFLLGCKKTEKQISNKSIKVLEHLNVQSNLDVYIIQVDSSQYIITYKGGIIKHK